MNPVALTDAGVYQDLVMRTMRNPDPSKDEQDLECVEASLAWDHFRTPELESLCRQLYEPMTPPRNIDYTSWISVLNSCNVLPPAKNQVMISLMQIFCRYNRQTLAEQALHDTARRFEQTAIQIENIRKEADSITTRSQLIKKINLCMQQNKYASMRYFVFIAQKKGLFDSKHSTNTFEKLLEAIKELTI